MPQSDRSNGVSDSSLRERIIDAAEKLFLERGYPGTTVEKIVSLARTSKREFYRHFPHREAVLLEMVSQLVNDENPIMSVPTGQLPDVLADAGHMMYVEHTRDRAMGLFRASIAAAMRSPQLAVAAYQSRSRTDGLDVYFEEKVKAGALAFDNPRLAGNRFGFLAIDGLRFMIGARPLSADEIGPHIDEVVDIAVNGHATPAFRKAPDTELRLPDLARLEGSGATKTDDAAYVSRLDEEVWDKLIDIAWEEFSANGFYGASVAAIAKSANLPRNTIYRRFKSKEALFSTSARRVILRAFDAEFCPENGASIQSQIENVADHLMQCFLNPDNLTLHKIMLAEAGKERDAMFNVYSELMALIENRLAPIFTFLVERNVIRRELSAKAAWRFFTLATFGSRFLFLSVAHPERQALIKEAVRMFLFGLTPRTSGGKAAGHVQPHCPSNCPPVFPAG